MAYLWDIIVVWLQKSPSSWSEEGNKWMLQSRLSRLRHLSVGVSPPLPLYKCTSCECARRHTASASSPASPPAPRGIWLVDLLGGNVWCSQTSDFLPHRGHPLHEGQLQTERKMLLAEDGEVFGVGGRAWNISAALHSGDSVWSADRWAPAQFLNPFNDTPI